VYYEFTLKCRRVKMNNVSDLKQLLGYQIFLSGKLPKKKIGKIVDTHDFHRTEFRYFLIIPKILSRNAWHFFFLRSYVKYFLQNLKKIGVHNLFCKRSCSNFV